jgi:hypothetical protein
MADTENPTPTENSTSFNLSQVYRLRGAVEAIEVRLSHIENDLYPMQQDALQWRDMVRILRGYEEVRKQMRNTTIAVVVSNGLALIAFTYLFLKVVL